VTGLTCLTDLYGVVLDITDLADCCLAVQADDADFARGKSDTDGDVVYAAADADIKPGNTLPVANIPVGTFIYNIELYPGMPHKRHRRRSDLRELQCSSSCHPHTREARCKRFCSGHTQRLVIKKKNSGRNSYGRITVRHKGGGNKQKYRIIDFKRQAEGAAKVIGVEYDPNRTAYIALLEYEDASS